MGFVIFFLEMNYFKSAVSPFLSICQFSIVGVLTALIGFVRVNHSDEGLTLETSVFESFTVANLPCRPCG